MAQRKRKQQCKICKNFVPDKHPQKGWEDKGTCNIKEKNKEPGNTVYSGWGDYCGWFESKEN